MDPLVIFACAVAIEDNHVLDQGGIVIHLIQARDRQGIDDHSGIIVRDGNGVPNEPDNQGFIPACCLYSGIREQSPKIPEIPVNPVIVPNDETTHPGQNNGQ